MKEEVSFMDREMAPGWSPSRAAARKEAKRKPVFYTYLNLWPFVAVLLVLLIVFMEGLGPIHTDIPVDLPSSFHGTAQPKGLAEDAMKVYVARDGRVAFRNIRVQAKSLEILILGAVGEGAERKVYLAVDSRAKYADAAAVVDAIGKAGIREISFLVDKREE